jgi:hypothetical protein
LERLAPLFMGVALKLEKIVSYILFGNNKQKYNAFMFTNELSKGDRN